MPTLKHLPNNGVAVKAPGRSHNYLKPLDTHVHLAYAAITVLVVTSLLIIHWRRSRSRLFTRPSGLQALDIKHDPTRHPLRYLDASPYGKQNLVIPPVWAKGRLQLNPSSGPGRGCQPPHEVRATRFLPVGLLSGQHRHLIKLPTMDDEDGKRGGGHHSGSAPTTPRAVSTTDSREYPGPSPFSPSAIMMTRGRRHPSPRTLSRVSLINRHSGSSDEIEESPSRGLGERPMAEHSDMIGGVGLDEQAGPANAFFHDKQVYATSAQQTTFPSLDFTVPRQFSRPPPPPPLIPPTRSAAVFPFEDRCPSYAVSMYPGIDRSFIHQPNPEYSGCSTSTDVLSSSPPSPTALPRRRSYTKSVPIGIPIPATTTSGASSPETVALRGTSAFFYASRPPTSPLPPPPPPLEYVFVGGPGGPGVLPPPQEIGLQGEIISVMDDAGQGWKRHTRVYGGGACLACVAARERGEGQGGFYGDTVPLADRR